MPVRRTLIFGGGALAIVGAGAMYAVAQDMGSLQDYAGSMARIRSALRQMPDLGEALRYATLAPSGHNTQPWIFRLEDQRIVILPDLSRRTPKVDPDDHHLFVSLGCAAETLALACAANGRPGDIAFDPLNGGSVIISLGHGAASRSALLDAIPQRQSSRSVYDGRAVSPPALRILAAAAQMPGIDLALITDGRQISRLSDLVVQGNTLQMADPEFVRELRHWLRFSPRQALETGDGLFSATTGNPVLPDWLGPRLFDLAFQPSSENAKYARQISSSAGIAVFVAQHADPAHWVLAGRAAQRFALQATALGLKTAFINQPVEVPALQPDLAHLIGLPDRRPDLVMRFGYGPPMPFSARRPVKAVLA